MKWRSLLIVWTFQLMIKITGKCCHIIQLGVPPEKQPLISGGYILAGWHNNIYFACWLLRNRNLISLVSNSSDGQWVAQLMAPFGFEMVRGSSSKGGTQALLQMTRHAHKGRSFVISPDGPRGPRYHLQSGVIMLAKMTGLPIIPWHYEASSQWVFRKTWDQHKVPKPFSKIIHSFGDPFYVPAETRSTQLADYADSLQQQMMDNVNRVELMIQRKIL